MATNAKRRPAERAEVIKVKVPAADRNVIDQAASASGNTRSQFMLLAARKAACETLLDMNLIEVDNVTFKRFQGMFDAPAKRNNRLRRLMQMRAPWNDHTR